MNAEVAEGESRAVAACGNAGRRVCAAYGLGSIRCAFDDEWVVHIDIATVEDRKAPAQHLRNETAREGNQRRIAILRLEAAHLSCIFDPEVHQVAKRGGVVETRIDVLEETVAELGDVLRDDAANLVFAQSDPRIRQRPVKHPHVDLGMDEARRQPSLQHRA